MLNLMLRGIVAGMVLCTTIETVSAQETVVVSRPDKNISNGDPIMLTVKGNGVVDGRHVYLNGTGFQGKTNNQYVVQVTTKGANGKWDPVVYIIANPKKGVGEFTWKQAGVGGQTASPSALIEKRTARDGSGFVSFIFLPPRNDQYWLVIGAPNPGTVPGLLYFSAEVVEKPYIIPK